MAYADARLKASEEELLEALDGDLSAEHRLILGQLLAHSGYIEGQIAELRRVIVAGLAPEHSLLQALQTIPGIYETGTAMLLVEIGDDMRAFGSSEKLASWARVCPGLHESAGKRKSGQQRNGNPYVQRILCEVAHTPPVVRAVPWPRSSSGCSCAAHANGRSLPLPTNC